MKYKECLKNAMGMLAEDARTIFIGYNLLYGSKGYGTFSTIPPHKVIEMPVAENLMTGIALGMALDGYKPLLFFERHDFMLNALDSLVNHLSKVEAISKGEYRASVIIRATVGSKTPINPGLQHTQDFSEFFKKYLPFPVYELNKKEDIIGHYKKSLYSNTSSMFIERKDLYDLEI